MLRWNRLKKSYVRNIACIVTLSWNYRFQRSHNGKCIHGIHFLLIPCALQHQLVESRLLHFYGSGHWSCPTGEKWCHRNYHISGKWNLFDIAEKAWNSTEVWTLWTPHEMHLQSMRYAYCLQFPVSRGYLLLIDLSHIPGVISLPWVSSLDQRINAIWWWTGYMNPFKTTTIWTNEDIKNMQKWHCTCCA